MRKLTLAFCLAGLLSATQAQAGHGLFKHRAIPAYGASIPGNTAGYLNESTGYCPTCAASGGAAGYSGTGYSGTGSVAGSSTVAGSSEFGATNPPVRPYSYYAAKPLGTARGYYGYGEDQFPYYGRPYGHPYDPWTWPYMSSSYQNSLNRYYDPPVK